MEDDIQQLHLRLQQMTVSGEPDTGSHAFYQSILTHELFKQLTRLQTKPVVNH